MNQLELSKIICLRNAVSADELRDDGEYRDVLDDMRREGGKYGNLVTVVMPRPEELNGGEGRGPSLGGVGKVFFVYADVRSASTARIMIGGRKFCGRVVEAMFYPEERFAQGDLDG